VTSASQIVMPVVAIDDTTIGTGTPGAISRRLREQFHRFSVFS
jgi:D-alanine transaminase